MPQWWLDSYLEAIVSPRAKFHDARLLIEGEIFHVYLAGGLVDGGRTPLHAARVVQRRLCRQCHLEITVGTVTTKLIPVTWH